MLLGAEGGREEGKLNETKEGRLWSPNWEARKLLSVGRPHSAAWLSPCPSCHFFTLKSSYSFLLSAFFLYFSSKKISCFSLRQNTKLITLPLGLCSYPVTSYTYLYYLTSHAVLDVCLFVYKYYLSLSKIGSVSYSALYAEYMPSQCNLHGEWA